jgi:hypothetical protein
MTRSRESARGLKIKVPEILMRILALSALALVFVSGSAMLTPADAQAYDPRYPVCMKLFGGGRFGEGAWIDCSFTSLEQCRASASGRAAMCDPNPYFAPPPAPRRAHRRHR